MTVIEQDSHGNPTVYYNDGFYQKHIKFFVEYDYPKPGETGLIDAQVVKMEFDDGHVREFPRRFFPTELLEKAALNVATDLVNNQKPLDPDDARILEEHLNELL